MDFFREKKNNKKGDDGVFFNSQSNADKPKSREHGPDFPEVIGNLGENPNLDSNFLKRDGDDTNTNTNDEIVDSCSIVEDVYNSVNIEPPKHFPPFKPFDFRFISGLYKLNAVSKYMKKISNLKLDKVLKKKNKFSNQEESLNSGKSCFDVIMKSMATTIDAEFQVFDPESNKELTMMSIISSYESILYDIRIFLATCSSHVEYHNSRDGLKESFDDVNSMIAGNKEIDVKKIEEFIIYTNKIVGCFNATLELITKQLVSQDDVHKDIVKRINLMNHEKTEE